MARLPTPGGDNGNWGTILNDYLSQAHKPNGTLKDDSVSAAQLQDNAVAAAQIADGSISETLLDNNVQTKLNATGDWDALANKPDTLPGTLTVAAFNTPAGRGANFRCTGTDDQNTINAAIAALPVAGGRIKLLAGQYNLSNSVVIDRSHVDIEGESHMMWGDYNASYGNLSGSEGFGGAKLKATVNGVDLIRLAAVNIPDNGENRHRGIRISYLYLFGSNYTGKGVAYQSDHDLVHIDHVTGHRLEYGIYSTGDASFIHHNNMQDCVNGIYYVYGNGQVTNNIIWDCSGSGLIVGASDLAPIIAANNNIGNCVLDGIEVLGPVVVTGNEVVHCKRNQVWLRSSGGASVTGNVIRTNANTPAATGIRVDSHGNTVSGNTIRALTSTTGKAINTASTAVGNAITGNVIQGDWADPPVTLGMGNTIESNTGFNTSAGGSKSTGDGGVIPHGLLYKPTQAIVSGSVAGEIVTVTSIDATNITVAVKTHAGAAGTTQTVYWSAKIETAYIEGPALQTSGALVGWYKADDLALSDGASVTSWPDATAVGTNLAPHTTPPIFKTAIIGGKPVVRFNGTANAMVSTLFPTVTQPLTVFVVAKQITTGTTQTFLGARNGGGLSQTISAYLTSGGAPHGYANGPTVAGPTVTTTNPHVYEWVFTQYPSAKTGVDGVINTGGAGVSGMGGGITIGANGNASPSEFFNGDIAEVLVYAGDLSDADRSAIRAALGAKYGITVV